MNHHRIFRYCQEQSIRHCMEKQELQTKEFMQGGINNGTAQDRILNSASYLLDNQNFSQKNPNVVTTGYVIDVTSFYRFNIL